MGKFTIENKTILLNEKQPNIIGSIVLYFLTLIFFIITICTIIVPLFAGMGLHIGNILALGFFGYLTYLLLKMALWNAKGKEVIEITNNQLKYTADYYLFKEKVRSFDINNIVLTIEKENSNDNIGSIQINDSKNKIVTATKLDIDVAQQLIYTIESQINITKEDSNSK